MYLYIICAKTSNNNLKTNKSMKNLLEYLKDKLDNGEINIRTAAEKLCENGWTNYIDIDKAKILLGK